MKLFRARGKKTSSHSPALSQPKAAGPRFLIGRRLSARPLPTLIAIVLLSIGLISVSGATSPASAQSSDNRDPWFVTGDWNGDGKDTVGRYDAYRTGAWELQDWTSKSGATSYSFTFSGGVPPGTWGSWTNRPVVGDWDGNGTDTVGFYNLMGGSWVLRNSNSSGPVDVTFQFSLGHMSVKPIVGDWDGDGKDSVGLIDNNTNTWYLKNSNASGNADLVFQYGPANRNSLWEPTSGDWNGDRIDTVGYALGNNWYLRDSNTAGPATTVFTYGNPPVYDSNGRVTYYEDQYVGDWDDNRTDTPAIVMPKQPYANRFYMRNSNTTGYANSVFDLVSRSWSPCQEQLPWVCG